MPVHENTIQRKLVKIVLLISAVVVLLASTAILSYEFVTFRRATVDEASTISKIVATNSTAALAFDNADDANEILSALKAEQSVVAAGLYSKEGTLFSHYPQELAATEFPSMPENDGYRFDGSNLVGVQSVTQGEKRLGTLYLKWDLKPAYARFLFYGGSIIVIMTICLLAAAYMLSRMLRQQVSEPILELAQTAKAVSDRQDYSVRAKKTGDGEIGFLGEVFNNMLARIEEQNKEREQTQIRRQAQLHRMQLLERITRAKAERQDLKSIFQVVLGSLEADMPLDFGCMCLYDAATQALTVANVGLRSDPLALKLGMTADSRIPIDQNGLSTCVRGSLVYEPDIADSQFPFPKRLASVGLRSFVAAPLQVKEKVFGILIAGRYAPDSFSSPDCEFLRHLSEHVALAANQANLYNALQEAYDDLRQTQQAVMQQERLRALGQMASGIAHDINNAISPIALYTETLLEKEPNLSERARGYLQVTQHAIEDVAQTIARMREFYRQRESQLVLAPVQLNNLVGQVKDLTHAKWSDMPQQRGVVVNLTAELEQGLPAVMGVETEIREALVNLVFNAVDAMPEGGMITVRTRRVGTSVYLEVSDTGTGMDEATKRRCLEPFFTTKGERGTGLGLAMVYGMAQRNNAEVQIDSELGKGTTMRLVFPVASPTEVPVSPAPAAPGKPLRILIVDDDPMLIRALRDTLEGDGHTVVSAPGGQEGIDAFENAHRNHEPFNVVITDLGMPYVDGRKVSAAVKATSPKTPVILFTGWGQRLVAEHDVPEHVDRVLNKPPKLLDLRAALSALTGTNGSH